MSVNEVFVSWGIMCLISFNLVRGHWVLLSVLAYSGALFLFLVSWGVWWVSLVFFLVYIGALLVLFFFLFSLSGKEKSKQTKTPYIAVGTILLPTLGCWGWEQNDSSLKMSEIALMSGDWVSLLTMVSFICVVVWNLSVLKSANKTPLRPIH